MVSKGGKIPSGSKVSEGSKFSEGSKVSSGKSEYGASSQMDYSYWELQLNSMNRKQLRREAKKRHLSTSGTPTQLRNRLRKQIEKDLQKPSVQKDQTIKQANVENINNQSRITVVDEQQGKEIIIADFNTDEVSKAKIEGDMDSGIVGVSAENPMGREMKTVVQVLPESKDYSIEENPNDEELLDKAIELEAIQSASQVNRTEPSEAMRSESSEPNQVNRTVKHYQQLKKSGKLEDNLIAEGLEFNVYEINGNIVKEPNKHHRYTGFLEANKKKQERIKDLTPKTHYDFDNKIIIQEKVQGVRPSYDEIDQLSQELHSRGIVGRDLYTPGNVIKDSGGNLRVIDYSMYEMSMDSQVNRTEPNHQNVIYNDMKMDRSQLTLKSTFEVETQDSSSYWNYSSKTGKKTSLKPLGRQTKAIDNKYDQMGLPPFFKGRSYELIPPEDFKNAPKEKYAAESGDKLRQLGIKDGFSFRGNQIQTRVNKSGGFEGFYYQSGTRANPMPQFVRPETMIVDTDPLGHFQAKILEDYSGQSFGTITSEGKKTEIDTLLAYKGFAGNVTDSRGYRRADIVRDTIKEEFGASSLSYIPPGTSRAKDVSVSDQQIAVVSRVYSPDVHILVSTPEKNLDYDKTMEDIPDPIDPSLIFEPMDSKVREVNSDDILKAGVRKLKADPITIQSMLQALYNQKWITYPRANQIKAEDEPIRIVGTKNAEEARQRVEGRGKWQGRGFKGSVQERQLLEIIVKSIEANERGENYIERGSWTLYSKDVTKMSKTQRLRYEIASKQDVLFQGEQRVYTSEQLEIGLGERGILIEDLTDFVIDENLVTPATRTKVLEELRNAGILIQRQDRFVIDKRGLMMYAVNEYYTQQDFERSHQLKTQIYNAASIREIDSIAAKFDMLTPQDKILLKRYLASRVPELLEIEEDLAELDSF